jgi:CRISPR-associated protein Cmr4
MNESEDESTPAPVRPILPVAARTGLFSALTLTLNHVGSGASEGVVDAPVYRHPVTRLPVWPGPGCRGAIKAQIEPKGESADREGWLELFGTDADELGKGRQGILRIDDAQLLALPVAADTAVMAWVTSPWLLLNYLRMAQDAGIALPEDCLPVQIKGAALALAPQATFPEAFWVGDLRLEPDGDTSRSRTRDAWATHLAQLAFPPANPDVTLDAALRTALADHLVIVSDAAMKHLCEQIPLATRVSLKGGNAKSRHLWVEQYLPEFTLMVMEWSLQPSHVAKRFEPDLGDALRWIDGRRGEIHGVPSPPDRVQFGGKQSTGRGRVRLHRWLGTEASAWLETHGPAVESA